MGLPDDRNSFGIGLAIQTQYRRVTDRQTDRQTDRHAMTAMTTLTRSVTRVKSPVVYVLALSVI